MFTHVVAKEDKWGVLTHMWSTAPSAVLDSVIIRVYVDGESTASIQFTFPLASGVGFGDQAAPWGTDLIGKGAAWGAWNNNLRVPFLKSVRVTAQAINANGVTGGFYFIVRGAPNLPVAIGGFPVPIDKGARLKLSAKTATLEPLEWFPTLQLTSGSGIVLFHTLVVSSGNENFMEGCYHFYSPYNAQFPGVLISSGTEDYFDSAWYFNAGQFRLQNAGYTHFTNNASGVTWSAYRMHQVDPLIFSGGVQHVWRNGDLNDAADNKCNIQGMDGKIAGNPTRSAIISYTWYYVW